MNKKWYAQGKEHDGTNKGWRATVEADTRDGALDAYIAGGHLCAPAVRVSAWRAPDDAELSA